MSLSKAPKPLNRPDNLSGGRRYLGFFGCDGTMGGNFKQTGGIRVNP
jgi:hypothetical protein